MVAQSRGIRPSHHTAGVVAVAADGKRPVRQILTGWSNRVLAIRRVRRRRRRVLRLIHARRPVLGTSPAQNPSMQSGFRNPRNRFGNGTARDGTHRRLGTAMHWLLLAAMGQEQPDLRRQTRRHDSSDDE